MSTATGPGWTLTLGDCLEGMRSLEAHSIDAIVTDPPAGIGFMGNEWDADKGGRDGWVAWLTSVMDEAWRVIKPGGHALVWALPRTSHWTGTAIESADWEIRDVHHHIFGTGFPKSLNVSSIMHELLGVTDGEYGTALKPAVEHWILARKPLDGTYAHNIREHGTGALNVGGCRIDGVPASPGSTPPTANGNRQTHGAMIRKPYVTPSGRWPAHLSLDEYAALLLDEQSGIRSSGGYPAAGGQRTYGSTFGAPSVRGEPKFEASSGGASRFFFVAKAPRAEKDAGLEHLAKRSGGEATKRQDNSAGTKSPRAGAGRTGGVRNIHPTVKSIELMRWLVRLITPPNGLVLDMFAGSGTTGLGCVAEDMRFLGFEQSEEYFEIAKARLDANSRQQRLFAPTKTTNETKPTQPSLFGETGGL